MATTPPFTSVGGIGENTSPKPESPAVFLRRTIQRTVKVAHVRLVGDGEGEEIFQSAPPPRSSANKNIRRSVAMARLYEAGF